MTMYTIALLFACLVCTGNARRVQRTTEEVAGEEYMQEAKQALTEMLANGPSKELMERAAELQQAFQEDLKADPNLLEELNAKVAEVREALNPTQPTGEEYMQEAQQALTEMLANGPSKELMERAAQQLKAFEEDLKADPNLLEELDAKVAEVREAFRRAEAGPDSFAQELNPTKSLAALMLAASNAAVSQATGSLGRRAKVSRNPDSIMGHPGYMNDEVEPPASLKELAMKLNPVVGYFDPLKLGSQEFWLQSNEATVGWLRHSEIKHGRVAMAAFVGYLAQSNGLHFPWKLTGTISFADIAAAGSPPEQWDALPSASKWQIILFVGFLEFWSESSYVLEQDGLKHYMRGGEPGKYPTFKTAPHPVGLNLWDPLGVLQGPLSAEKRAKLDRGLIAEINNGRLAMLGIMGFLAEQKVPGAVPFLKVLNIDLKPYAGDIMDPFASAGM